MILTDIVSNRVIALELNEDISNLRGWSEQVRPRYSYLPTVSEMCSPCPTHRDVYLLKVEGYRIESNALENGRLIHEAFLIPFKLALKEVHDIEKYAGIKRALLSRIHNSSVRRLASKVYDHASAMALQWLILGRPLPIAVEPKVRASLVGLSDTVRPDLVIGITPYEFASSYWSKKELAVVAYAMAIEATSLSPVNYGVLVYPNRNGLKYKVIPTNETLRKKVLDVRDTIDRIVYYEEDPGPANRMNCSKSCPFWGVCHDRA